MKILVTGSGRSCTNWMAEIVKSCGKFHWVGVPEDRSLYMKPMLPDNYASKLATDHPSFTEASMRMLMSREPDLNIFWCFKHPVANVMSKIVRGQPHSKGGDKPGENVSADGTLKMAIEAVRRSWELCRIAEGLHSIAKQVMRVRLEDLILRESVMRTKIAGFMQAERDEVDMKAFVNTPNMFHKARYGGTVHRDQTEIYQRWESAYDGFFKDRRDDIDKAVTALKDMCKDLEYEL